jgi:hypothetical protein
MLLGNVLVHRHGTSFETETARFAQATTLYINIQALILQLDSERTVNDVSLAAPLALSFSILCSLCEPYSCPEAGYVTTSDEAGEMVTRAIKGLQHAAESVVIFADRLNRSVPEQKDLDRISPIIMDAIYSAAAQFAWLVRESGDQDRLDKLNILRSCMKRFGGRWHNAAEYLRILEAQEFTYAVRP